MNRRQRPSPDLLRLARLQAGVVSREQALGLGLSDRVLQRLAREQWRALGRGIYVTLPVEPSWDALAWGGVLAGGDSARLGPLASGWLHGLVEAPPAPIDVLTAASVRRRDTDRWTFSRERPGSRLVRTVGSPPLEMLYLRNVERAHGLPAGRRQQSVSGLPHRTDVDYLPYPLLVELDGALYHDGRRAFWDMDRDNAHAMLNHLTANGFPSGIGQLCGP